MLQSGRAILMEFCFGRRCDGNVDRLSFVSFYWLENDIAEDTIFVRTSQIVCEDEFALDFLVVAAEGGSLRIGRAWPGLAGLIGGSTSLLVHGAPHRR